MAPTTERKLLVRLLMFVSLVLFLMVFLLPLLVSAFVALVHFLWTLLLVALALTTVGCAAYLAWHHEWVK